MLFQKENISDQFGRYTFRNIRIIIGEISENKFKINYIKLIKLLSEGKCKRYNKPINDNFKNILFKNYIKNQKNMNYMNIHNKIYINTKSLRKNRWFIPPRKRLY